MEETIFISGGWEPLLRIIVVGTLAYFSLVLLIRVNTKRALAQLSAFDFVITVALGSAYGRILTATEVGLVDAVVAFALLAALQYLLAAAQTRWPRFSQMVKSPPSLVYYQGAFIREALRREKLSEAEVESAVRAAGMGSFDGVEAVVMESGGNFAVIPASQMRDGAALESLTNR